MCLSNFLGTFKQWCLLVAEIVELLGKSPCVSCGMIRVSLSVEWSYQRASPLSTDV